MKRRQHKGARKRQIVKNPVSAVDEHLHPFPQMAPLASVPGVTAILERARKPYQHNPLTEDEALNLVCDARKHEPTFPLKKLLHKYKDELRD
jgi:hypothetical protein